MEEIVAKTIWKLGTLGKKAENRVLITGSPRSGTTWLLEIIEKGCGARWLWEPFLYGVESSEEDNFNVGLGMRPFLPVEEESEKLESLLHDVLSERYFKYPEWARSLSMSRMEYSWRILFSRWTIFKFCRAQRLIPWIDQQIGVKSILMIRHPLAVISSQLNHPSFSEAETNHPIVSEAVARRWPELAEYVRSLERFEEKLAASWSFDYFIPLQQWSACENTLLVTYEGLVTRPGQEISRMQTHLGASSFRVSDEQLAEPSATTREDAAVVQGQDRLTSWKDRLSSDQVDRILRVVHRFGLDFYTDALRPDEDCLREWMDTSPRA